MDESGEKFKAIVSGSIEQAKEIHKIRISKDNIEKITERIFINVKNYIDERYGKDNSK